MGFDPLTFIFTGVYAQTLFQSPALGVVSLLEDRENDFTQELFVSPVSRYAIVAGKITGESLVALIQGCAVIAFGLVIGVSLPLLMIGALLVVGLLVCLFGGAFGLLVLGNISSQRTANQIFPLIFFPQMFLAGIFNPIKHLPSIFAHLCRATRPSGHRGRRHRRPRVVPARSSAGGVDNGGVAALDEPLQ
jgi:ABC-2 type transport system permease protein